MDLDEWDKLMIVMGVALFLILVLFCLVCVLCPWCCLHKYCCCTYEDDDKSALQPMYGSMDDPLEHPRLRGSKGKGQQGHKRHPMMALRESEASDWSDISAPEVIEMKQDTGGRRRRTSRTSDYSSSASSVGGTSPQQPDSRLAYGVLFDRAHNKLLIRIVQLGNFRVTDPDGAMAPYIKVKVYRTPKQFFTFKLKQTAKEKAMNNLEIEFQTKIQRRTDNPIFNEFFEVHVEDNDISAYTIRFLVCDFDKFSRHVVVGEVICELSKQEIVSGEEKLYSGAVMAPHEENLGDIHVALMYLPTAEKLSVTILNLRGLRSPEGPKRNMEVFVKTILVYDGRPLKKTKTVVKENELNPVFNETFVFDVPAYQLDKVHFAVTVIGVDKDKEDGRHLLGRLYIGVNFDPDIRAQWLEMVHNARKQVACWHKLQS